MNERAYDYLVIGGGVAGLSTVYYLAREGHRNGTFLERESIVGPHASSKNSGMIHHYHPDRAMRKSLGESVRNLRSYHDQKDRTFFHSELPSLFFLSGQKAGELMDNPDPAGDPVLRSSGDVPASVKPRNRSEEGQYVAFNRDGLLDARLFMGVMAEDIKRMGITPHKETTVHGGTFDGEWWKVETDRGIFRSRFLYNAAGAWIDEVAEQFGIPSLGFSPATRHLFYTEDNLLPPDLCFLWDRVHGVYFRHDDPGTLLCACDNHPGEPGDLNPVRDPVQMLKEKLYSFYPQFSDVRIDDYWSCQRTGSPENGPVIRTSDDQGRFAWVGGLHGHGMTGAFHVGQQSSTLYPQP